MIAQKKKQMGLNRRKLRVRRKVTGCPDRPRLLVCRSTAHTCAQIIEAGTGVTLAAASTRQRKLRGNLKSTGCVEAAKAVGKEIAERALAQGITKICFDRGGRKYHGRVRALAEAVREAGLKF